MKPPSAPVGKTKPGHADKQLLSGQLVSPKGTQTISRLCTEIVLPITEKMAMKMLVIFVLGMNHWTCTGKEPGDRGCLPLMMWLCLDPDPDSLCPCVPVYPGFPVYDYDPASLKEALSASVAKVNSQSLSPYLFRAFRSSVKRVSACYISILFCFFSSCHFLGVHIKIFPV